MRYLLALLLCLPCFGALAQSSDDALLKQVLDHLAAHGQVRATFTQSRENPALAQPQQSHGNMLFVVGKGMLWQVREPYQESLVLKAGGTAHIDENGQQQPARNGDRGVAQVSQMLQSLLSGKPDDALRQFDVQASGTPAQWTLHFTPRQARMAHVLAGIELQGDDYLQAIRVLMANGETTTITFSDTRDAGALSPLEAHALASP